VLRYCLIVFSAILVSQNLLSQDGSFQDWQEDLYEIEKSKDLSKTIDKIDELDKYYFNDIDGVVFELIQDETFRFMFAKRLGWKQVVHQEAEDQLAHFFSEDLSVLTGKDITDMFGLHGKPQRVDPFSSNQNASDRFEEVFVLRAKDEPFAVVVHIHNYPNGNMTSWYVETRYYFTEE
jgi:hypothetical protein